MISASKWKPSPFLKATAAIHLGAVAAIIAAQGSGPLLVGGIAALVLNHLALALSGLLPRCAWLGPVLTRLPVAGKGVAITIDDGPDPEVTPRVLDLLDAHQAHATFFVIGRKARLHAALTREIAARGHTIENHSEQHLKTFSLRGPGWMGREIAAGRQTIRELTGLESRFFRAPAGLRNPFLDPVLHRLGITLAAWTRRAYDTRCGDAAEVLARLTQKLAAGDILLLHDGHAARTANGTPVILEVLPPLLEAIKAAGLRPVTLDGQP